MKDKISVLLADDHTLVRMGLKMLLTAGDGFSVVGEAENGEEAVRLTKARRPDVVVMDLMMPVLNGTAATEQIHASCPKTRILILTTFADPGEIAATLAAGATGALLKSTANTEILTAIRSVSGGVPFISDEIRELLADIPSAPALTDRQLQVLASVTRGLSNREISILLGISKERIKQHLNAIYEKLGAANRTEAVAIALRQRLLKV